MSASPYAGLVSRLIALVVDCLVVTILVLVIGTLPEQAWASVSPRTQPHWLAGFDSVVAYILAPLYFAVLWATTGRTVGGLVTGIEVTHRNGRELNFRYALMRAVIGIALAPVWLVGMVAILWDNRRRAWHDRVLGTVVRYTKPRS